MSTAPGRPVAGPAGGVVRPVDVLVIGAGPAGLAAAHELMRAGRQVMVLEQGTGVATSWRAHRAGLRLHTVRRRSALPGTPIPRRYGRHVSSADLVRYLEDYAAGAGISIRFGVTVVRVRRAGEDPRLPGWAVETDDGRYQAVSLVIATGYNRVPYVPDLPGLQAFSGQHLHVADYRGGNEFAGRHVLVVGAGNAAAEAATELVGVAGKVDVAVRTTPHLVRPRVCGISTQAIAIALSVLPVRMADRVASGLSRLTIPDLTSRQMPRPVPDLYTRVRASGSVPVHDTGIVTALSAGAVIPVAAVTGFGTDSVQLADGTCVQPDVVVFATGYRRGLEEILDGLDLLDAHGEPHARSGTEAAPGLSFVGFTVTATGALRELARDARGVAGHTGRPCPAGLTRGDARASTVGRTG